MYLNNKFRYRIYLDILKGEKIVGTLGCYFPCHLLVSTIILYWGIDGVKGEKGGTSFTLLEYMIMWCKIHVIINPL